MPTRKTKTAAKKKTATKASTAKKSKRTAAASAKRPTKKAPAKKAAKATKSAPARKAAPKKKVAKKAVKKAAPKSTKAAVRKAAAPKKAAATKKALKKAAKTPAPKKTVTTAAAPKKKSATSPSKEKAVLDARKRKQTPSIFKIRNRRNTPIVFTLDDVKEILDKRRQTATEAKSEKAKTKAGSARKATVAGDAPQENRVLGAASLADILGFNPAAPRGAEAEEASIPAKFKKFHKALIELRDRVRDGLSLHTSETLRKSSKDESGDLSGYGQHMADAGSDSADRDFALSLVSNEQELLYEIEEALKRMREGNYGNCEITGEPIDKERLLAVPFTRYSLEGQRQLESNRRRSRAMVGGGIFSDASEESSLTEDDGDS